MIIKFSNAPLLIVALLITLSVLASAERDAVSTGPYKVSFDLGLPHSSYNVVMNEPKKVETLSGDAGIEYTITISNRTSSRIILITIENHTRESPIMSGSALAEGIKSSDSGNKHISILEAANRNIDGVDGAIVSTLYGYGLLFEYKGYQAIYQPSFDPTHTSVAIVSYYPWDEGTRQLLNTIHVSRAS